MKSVGLVTVKAVGIIAEYNPLHKGHVYHMQKARDIAGCEAVVVAMSGNFVQRGEPAILNKWDRARLAVMNGADLVVEIPALYCLGNAGQYASAGVTILEAIPSVEFLAFGSESGSVDRLTRIAGILAAREPEIAQAAAVFLAKGYTFPEARAAAFRQVTGEELELGSNDVLGLEYLRAVKRLEPVAVERAGAGYNEGPVAGAEFQSATGIRELLGLCAANPEWAESTDSTDSTEQVESADNVEAYVPGSVFEALNDRRLSSPDMWLDTLKYAVMNMTVEQIDDCPSGDAGIGVRVKAAVAEAKTWQDFVLAVKSRNYTYSRISRLCCQIILGITRSEYEACDPTYIRVLAMNDRGRHLLAEMREREGDDSGDNLKVITKVGREQSCLAGMYDRGEKLLKLDIKSADIYNLVTGADIARMSDYRVHPYVSK